MSTTRTKSFTIHNETGMRWVARRLNRRYNGNQKNGGTTVMASCLQNSSNMQRIVVESRKNSLTNFGMKKTGSMETKTDVKSGWIYRMRKSTTHLDLTSLTGF
jgi:hypothetical protein